MSSISLRSTLQQSISWMKSISRRQRTRILSIYFILKMKWIISCFRSQYVRILLPLLSIWVLLQWRHLQNYTQNYSFSSMIWMSQKLHQLYIYSYDRSKITYLACSPYFPINLKRINTTSKISLNFCSKYCTTSPSNQMSSRTVGDKS